MSNLRPLPARCINAFILQRVHDTVHTATHHKKPQTVEDTMATIARECDRLSAQFKTVYAAKI